MMRYPEAILIGTYRGYRGYREAIEATGLLRLQRLDLPRLPRLQRPSRAIGCKGYRIGVTGREARAVSCPCFRRSRDRSIVKSTRGRPSVVSMVRPGRDRITPGAPADQGGQ